MDILESQRLNRLALVEAIMNPQIQFVGSTFRMPPRHKRKVERWVDKDEEKDAIWRLLHQQGHKAPIR